MPESDRIDTGGVTIPADAFCSQVAAERQREIDNRMALHFSTTSEHAAYDFEAVRELYRKAI